MELIMKNAKAKFANARKIFSGMSTDFYLMTDYISKNVKDNLTVQDIIITCMNLRCDFENGRNGFGGEFSKEINQRKDFLLNEIRWIPQFIDESEEKDFAENLRSEWRKTMGYISPRRIKTSDIKTDIQYPEYIMCAIDWWANAILAPKFDSGKSLPGIIAILIADSLKEYTVDEIKTFKNCLASEIVDEMVFKKQCMLDVDYQPCRILEKAGSMIGVSNTIGYPCKTYMIISENDVIVKTGYTSDEEIIWHKKTAG